MGIADTIAECVISCRYVESVEVIPCDHNLLLEVAFQDRRVQDYSDFLVFLVYGRFIESCFVVVWV